MKRRMLIISRKKVRKFLLFLCIFAISFFLFCHFADAKVNGLISSGDSLKNIAKIGYNYVGQGYYQFASGTDDLSDLNLNINVDPDYTLPSQTGTRLFHFTTDICVNGSKPYFYITSMYDNYVDYFYSLGSTQYVANGDWASTNCYRAFIRLTLNYNLSLGTQGNDYLNLTNGINYFHIYATYGYDTLLRFNDLVYYTEDDYNQLMLSAQQLGSSSDIIDNNNTNTNNIINNQNTNSQNEINNATQNKNDIINNQNSNTDKEIESQQVCNTILINKYSNFAFSNSYLDNSGNVNSTDESFGVTDYFSINDNSSLIVTKKSIAGGRRYCFYDNNKDVISCNQGNQFNSGTSISIPTNSKFIRFTIDQSLDSPNFEFYTCQNGNQALNDNINNLNDNIKNDNVDESSSKAMDFFNNFENEDFGLSDVITMPLTLISRITSATCSPLQIPMPFVNQNVTLPCMYDIYSTYFGSFLTIYQTITFGIIAYWVSVNIFAMVKGFKDPDSDEIQVMEL